MSVFKDFSDPLVTEHTKQDLVTLFKQRYPDKSLDLIEKAYELSSSCLIGKTRKSGRTYLQHAINVAYYVCYFGLGENSISASLLHDAVDFGLSLDKIEDHVSKTVRSIIEALENIKSIKKYQKSNVSDDDYSDYMRRLIIELSQDVRPIVIRLCEILDALYDVEYLSKGEQKSSFDACLKIYSPLAEFLSLGFLRTKIQDLAFYKSDSKNYLKYKKWLETDTNLIERNSKKLEQNIKILLNKKGVKPLSFFGRKKGVYSYFKKIQDTFVKYNETAEVARFRIYDIYAYTIIVDSIEDCYKSIDCIHSNYPFIYEELNDYIANPKPNGFRCLQTKITPFKKNQFVEIQIKTLEMHEVNEYGVASHVYYKLYGSNSKCDEKKLSLLKNLVAWKSEFKDESSYLINHSNSTILVLSPAGDVIELPKNSVPLDYAYAIHTELGDKYRFARVNGSLVKSDYRLRSGDVVEILIDAKRKYPSRDWLGFVQTPIAKNRIRHKLKEGVKIF